MAAGQQEQAVGAVDFAAAVRGAGLAVGLGALGALVVAVAPLLGPATADDGSQQGGQPLAAVLAGLLVLLGPLLAGALLRGGRLAGAVGVLTGGGAVAGALAVLDLQLLVRPLDANRLELVRPVVVAELHAGPGAFAVLVGHLLAALAALVCARSVRRSGVLDDPDAVGDGRAAGEGPVLGRAGPPAVALSAAAALVVTGALFAAPLTSTDPIVLVPAVVQSPVAVLVGTALLAVVVLVALALALVSGSVSRASGVLAGVGVGVLSLVAPRWAAAALEDGVGVGVGSVVGTLGALALVGSAAAVLVAARRRAARPPVVPAQPEAVLPGPRTLHLVAALTGLLAGVLAVTAALLPLLSTTGGVAEPDVAQTRVLLLAGVVLAACCAGMLGGFAAALRPVVGVAWVGLVLGGGGVLQAVLVATDVTGVGWGSGAVLAVLAVLAAGVCAAATGFAGAAERDDVDTSDAPEPARPLVVVAGLAGLAVLLGLALPLYSAPGFSSAALVAGGWGWDSWGLAVTAVALLVALAVAVRARPARAVAVLAGAVLVVVVHLVSWPLTAGRVAGSAVAAGVPLTVLAVLALGATLVLVRREDGVPGRPR